MPRPRSLRVSLALPAASVFALIACSPAASETPAPKTPPPASSASAPATSASVAVAPEKKRHDAFARDALNRLAVRSNLPLFWVADANHDGAIDPAEVKTLLFYPTATAWTKDGAFTKEFEDAYAQLVAAKGEAPKDPEADAARRTLVRADLDGATSSIVYADFSKSPADEKTFVRHMLAIANLVETLFAKQNGSAALVAKVPADDLASQSLFRRDSGPKCATPKLAENAACSAIPGAPKPLVDVYPASLQADGKFCEALGKRKDGEALLAPFVAVREQAGKLVPVPFSQAYEGPMTAIALELEAAANDLKDAKEDALRLYLRAAATSFRTNEWLPADEAWAKMTAENSRWYVRVGPDETYWEPCAQKGGFHLTFAKINRDSLAWQDKLKPHQQAMEDALAKLIGPAAYKARKVTFHLPDFIDIVVNAGDDRDALSATIGQSLPNWGAVANEGRGRTVAMSNLFQDDDSKRQLRTKAESLFTKESLGSLSDDPAPGLLDTILHEATHNLGPAHEYKFQGKKDTEAFGGELAAMLEELKAQSGSLWFTRWAEAHGVISAELARQSLTESLVWCMGHIGGGMWQDGTHRKPYAQLSAIQIGFLLDEGALRWDEKATAANGKDEGAFVIVWDKLPAATEKLMKAVATLKAKNDKKAALALADKYVDGKTVPHAVVVERWRRLPSTSFVYAVDL
jgi:hypothetical protein